jgi:hypothetical protein
MNRLTPLVEAPYGTPLKVYTSLRLHPRIFPAVVSTTVAVSDAITTPRSQLPEDAFEGLSGASSGWPFAVSGRRTELESPAPNAAMPPTKDRLDEEGVKEETIFVIMRQRRRR